MHLPLFLVRLGMGKRYITQRWSDQWQGEVIDIGQAHTVFETERIPRRTGLLDASGNPLYAVDEMDQIGFIRSNQTA